MALGSDKKSCLHGFMDTRHGNKLTMLRWNHQQKVRLSSFRRPGRQTVKNAHDGLFTWARR